MEAKKNKIIIFLHPICAGTFWEVGLQYALMVALEDKYNNNNNAHPPFFSFFLAFFADLMSFGME